MNSSEKLESTRAKKSQINTTNSNKTKTTKLEQKRNTEIETDSREEVLRRRSKGEGPKEIQGRIRLTNVVVQG